METVSVANMGSVEVRDARRKRYNLDVDPELPRFVLPPPKEDIQIPVGVYE